MKKCIVVSDSFKGTLSSMQIAYICEQSIPLYFPECEVVPIPIADGGVGTVDSVFATLGADPITISVCGPYLEPVMATYAQKDDIAIIEMASACGLHLVGNKRNPALTSTFGVGEMIYDAVSRGCKHIYLGLGESATNDGGCGCAAALGVKFYNTSEQSYVPVGETLDKLINIDISEAAKFLEDVQITIMCDVSNPLYGPKGAAYAFGAQKGADDEMVHRLDSNLENFNSAMFASLGKDMTYVEGGGAGGGMAAGVMAMLDGKIVSGIDAMLGLTNFEKELTGCDLVITGEGRLDEESFHGKVIDGITRRTLPREIPVYCIVGNVGNDKIDYTSYGISAIFETNREQLPLEEIKEHAWEAYTEALAAAMRYHAMVERRNKTARY